jgi:CDP-glycerol glycerophosphotransferase
MSKSAPKIFFRNDGPFWSAGHLLLIKALQAKHPEYELIWEGDKAFSPPNVKAVPAGSCEAGRHLSSARIVFDYLGRNAYQRGSRNQFYILSADRNLWFETPRVRAWTPRSLKAARRTADFIITSGCFETNIFDPRRPAYYGSQEPPRLPVYEWGHPVNAILGPGKFNSLDRDSIIKEFKNKFNLSDGQKIALFDSDEALGLDWDKLREALGCRFGNDWLPFGLGAGPKGDITSAAQLNDWDRFGALLAAEAAVISASGFPAELLLNGRPCFFYASKVKNLDALEEFNSVFGWPLASTENDLLDHIKTYDETEHGRKLAQALRNHSSRDISRATEKISGFVESLVDFYQDQPQVYYRYGGVETDKALWKLNPFRWAIRKLRRLSFSLWQIVHFSLKIIILAASVLCGFRPIRKNKIAFSMIHHRYACNPKYIIEEILRRRLPYELVYIIDVSAQPDFHDIPREVRVVDMRSYLRYFSEFGSARIWITNSVTFMPYKKSGQFFIQTWHGSLGIKKATRSKIAQTKILSATDLCISNSAFETKVYRTSHWPGVKSMEYGHPRNDILCPEAGLERAKQAKDKVYGFYNLAPDEKIILYAPTFRDNQIRTYQHNRLKRILNLKISPSPPENWSCYRLSPQVVLPALAKKFGGRWRFLFRLHHVTRTSVVLANYFGDSAINASDYHDIQELMVASEIMISDYSSCLFDFMLTRRPAFIFATDMAEYENDRGFYYSPRSTPFPVAESNEELEREILNFDPGRYQEEVAKFLAEKGCREDGQASRRVVDLLQSLIEGKSRGQQ